MAFQFLCPAHRRRMAEDPTDAQQCWELWMDSGREAFARRDWRQAVRFLGSSFELSEILLGADPEPGTEAVDRFMVSGHFLAECFARTGNGDLQHHCLLAVHHRLLNLLRNGVGRRISLAHNVEFSLEMLGRYYQNGGCRDAFEHCRRESYRLLRRCYH